MEALGLLFSPIFMEAMLAVAMLAVAMLAVAMHIEI